MGGIEKGVESFVVLTKLKHTVNIAGRSKEQTFSFFSNKNNIVFFLLP
jgi:hypothetical protein